MKKNSKGITLVALVITIITLLILSSVSIATLTNIGLFEKTKLAKQKSENAEIEENETLNNYVAQIDSVTNSRDSISTGKTLLWSGKYNTDVNLPTKQTSGGCKLNDNCNIEDYEFLLILTTIVHPTTNLPEYNSTIFPVDIIKQNYGLPTIEISTYVDSNYFTRFCLGFINNESFYIAWRNLSGWTDHYVSYIYGIK